MPNIELVGFGTLSQDMETKITDLIKTKIPEVIKEGVVITVHLGSVVKDINVVNNFLPYVRVASTELKDRSRVAKLINEELGLDVEWLLIDHFFEGKH